MKVKLNNIIYDNMLNLLSPSGRRLFFFDTVKYNYVSPLFCALNALQFKSLSQFYKLVNPTNLLLSANFLNLMMGLHCFVAKRSGRLLTVSYSSRLP